MKRTKPRPKVTLPVAPVADVSGLVRFWLTGPGIYRETIIFVKPDRVQETIVKYGALGQTMRGQTVYGQTPVVAPAPLARVVGKSPGSVPVVCTTTGAFFHNKRDAERATGLSFRTISRAISGEETPKSGLAFRLATLEEVVANEGIPQMPVAKAEKPVTQRVQRAIPVICTTTGDRYNSGRSACTQLGIALKDLLEHLNHPDRRGDINGLVFETEKVTPQK